MTRQLMSIVPSKNNRGIGIVRFPTAQTDQDIKRNFATMSASENTMKQTNQFWNGRIVARILPEDIDEDFDRTKKPLNQKIDPLVLVGPPHGERTSTTTNERFSSSSKHGELSSSNTTKETQEATQIPYKAGKITIDINVVYEASSESEDAISETIRLTRTTSEDASQCLNRIGINLAKKINATKNKKNGKNKKKKRGPGATSDNFSVRCLVGSSDDPMKQVKQELDLNGMTNLDFWSKALTLTSASSLSIEMQLDGDGDTTTIIRFDVESNPPTVVGIRTFENFCGQNFPGVPLVVDVDLLFATYAIVNWYVDGKLVQKDSRGYIPTLQDANRSLAITVTPTSSDSEGATEAFQFSEKIASSIPENALLTLRPEWQHPRSTNDNPEDRSHSSDLRIMTYNILADQNAFSKVNSKIKVPFFPYVDKEILIRSRRMPLLLHEILAYHSDIICLQEVDQLVYDELLLPALEYAGYQGYFSVKQTYGTQEGCAMFWSLQRFQKAKPEDIKTYRISHLLASMCGLEPDDSGWNESVSSISQLFQTRPDLLVTDYTTSNSTNNTT